MAPTLRSLCTGLRPAVNFDGILKEREAAETPLKIEAAGLLPPGEDTAQQCGYFARHLRLDRRGPFFPLL